MTDYTRVASYDVTSAIWTELQNAGLFNSNDYLPDGFDVPLIPIFPAQQIPEMNNLLPGKPYFTYDVSQKNFNTQFWIVQEEMTLEFVSRNNAQINTVLNFLLDLLRRYEKSATDINVDVAGSPYRFLYFKIDSTDPVQAFTDEGGYMSAVFTFTYSYTREVDQGTGRYL